MKFYCDNCNAKYLIADDKVQGKILRIRCKKCSHVIVVREPAKPATSSMSGVRSLRSLQAASSYLEGGSGTYASPAQTKESQDQVEWYYALGGQTHGPFSLKALRDKFATGQLGDEAYVWKETFANWVPATDREEFAPFFARGLVRKPARPTMALKAIDVEAAVEKARAAKAEGAAKRASPSTALGPPGDGSPSTALGRPGESDASSKASPAKASRAPTPSPSRPRGAAALLKRASEVSAKESPPKQTSTVSKRPSSQVGASTGLKGGGEQKLSQISATHDTSARLKQLRSRLSSTSGTVSRVSLKERLRQLRQTTAAPASTEQGSQKKENVHDEVTRVQMFSPFEESLRDEKKSQIPKASGPKTPLVEPASLLTLGQHPQTSAASPPADQEPPAGVLLEGVDVESEDATALDALPSLSAHQEVALADEVGAAPSEEATDIASAVASAAAEGEPSDTLEISTTGLVSPAAASALPSDLLEASPVTSVSASSVEDADSTLEIEAAGLQALLSGASQGSPDLAASVPEPSASEPTPAAAVPAQPPAATESAPVEALEDEASPIAAASLAASSADIVEMAPPSLASSLNLEGLPVSMDEGDDQVLDLRGQRAMEEMERSNKRSRLVLVMAVILLCVVGAGLTYAFLGSNDATSETPKTNSVSETSGEAPEASKPPEKAVAPQVEVSPGTEENSADGGVAAVADQDVGEALADAEGLSGAPAEGDAEIGEGKTPPAVGSGGAAADAGADVTEAPTKSVTPKETRQKPRDKKAEKRADNKGLSLKSGAGTDGGAPSAFESAMRSGRAPVKVETKEAPPAEDLPSTLSRAAIQQGFKKVGQSVQQCLDRYMKKSGGEKPAGKVKVVVTIQKNGSVSKVSVGNLASTSFGKCLIGKSRQWRFQAFSGPPINVSRQFVLK